MNNNKVKVSKAYKKTRLVPSGTFPPAAVTITRQLPKKCTNTRKKKKRERKLNKRMRERKRRKKEREERGGK